MKWVDGSRRASFYEMNKQPLIVERLGKTGYPDIEYLTKVIFPIWK